MQETLLFLSTASLPFDSFQFASDKEERFQEELSKKKI